MTGLDPGQQFPGPDRTVQDEWFDAQLRHQIGLLRVVGGIRNRVWRLLDQTETDMRRQIRDRLDRGTAGAAGVARLERLTNEIREIRNTPWRQIRTVWVEEMEQIALREPQFTDDLLKTVVPTRLETTLPPARQLRSLVSSTPFQGRTMRQWADSIRRSDIRSIEDQIRIGVVQQETPREIARRVVGSAQLRGRDGVTQITRRNAEAITRTATNHYANQARQDYFEENAEFFDEELYVATLDSRTTRICSSLDGERFPIGKGPIPPLHFNCRSLRTAILDPEAIGSRPFNAATEQRLIREFAEQEGLASNLRRRASLPRGTKGRFDEFARLRTRELIGQVPAKTTYTDFLRRQGAQFQDDVLGPARGRLFRQGGLELRQFVNRAGDELSLDELARLHRDAFKRAGLDPAEFVRRN